GLARKSPARGLSFGTKDQAALFAAGDELAGPTHGTVNRRSVTPMLVSCFSTPSRPGEGTPGRGRGFPRSSAGGLPLARPPTTSAAALARSRGKRIRDISLARRETPSDSAQGR